MPHQIRQGDVLLTPVTELPQGAHRRDEPGLRIAGERTGHAHVLHGEVYALGRSTFIRVAVPGEKITHEEHAHLDVPMGLYEVRVQREFIPGAGTVPRFD